MTHSNETINRIRLLLKDSGVPEGEVLEEMIDHYLSEIEAQIELNIDPQEASLITFQKIEATDFRRLKHGKGPGLRIILALLFLCVFFIFNYWII